MYAIFVVLKSGNKLVWEADRESPNRYYLGGSGILPLIFFSWQGAYAKLPKVKKEWTDRKGHLCHGKKLIVQKVLILEEEGKK